MWACASSSDGVPGHFGFIGWQLEKIMLNGVLWTTYCMDLDFGRNGEVDSRMYVNYFRFNLGERFSKPAL